MALLTDARLRLRGCSACAGAAAPCRTTRTYTCNERSPLSTALLWRGGCPGLQVSKRWLLWTVVSIVGAFMLVSLYFVWRGFRNWRRYKKALAEESSWTEAEAAGGRAAVERAAGGRQVWAARLPRQWHDAVGAPPAQPPALPSAGSVLLELPVLRRPEGSAGEAAAPAAGYTAPAAWRAGMDSSGTPFAAPAEQGPRSSAPGWGLAARAPPGSSTAARAGTLGRHPRSVRPKPLCGSAWVCGCQLLRSAHAACRPAAAEACTALAAAGDRLRSAAIGAVCRSAGDLESGVGLGAEEPTAVDPELLRRLGLRSLPRPLPGLR